MKEDLDASWMHILTKSVSFMVLSETATFVNPQGTPMSNCHGPTQK